MLKDQVDRVERRVDGQAERINAVEDELVVVPVMKRAFYWLAVVITGAIVAVVGSAVAIILSTGGPK